MIHVCIGTKAQYIKTAPLLHELDSAQVPYRLIDTGQHAAFSKGLRRELKIGSPDVSLGGSQDVKSIVGAVVWMVRLLTMLIRPRTVYEEVFNGQAGICVLHGDTPSTLVGLALAKRAGLDVAHLEAGLRSHSLIHPFPEELIRLMVMKRADVLFAPSSEAAEHLRSMRVNGHVVELPANSTVEALAAVQSRGRVESKAVVTVHRVENLHRKGRLQALLDIVTDLAATYPMLLVLHPPTEGALSQSMRAQLRLARVETAELMPHSEFVSHLEAAPFVITDGGSIQEECALLGVPTLLWRERTERPDGLGRNVVLSRYRAEAVDEFMANLEKYRYQRSAPEDRPSRLVLDHLRPWSLEAPASQ